MNFKKNSTFITSNREIIFISIAYFFTRLINLNALPIFNDEAIYLDWGWREITQSGNFYYSLYDGKQPLLMWIFGIFEKVLTDPLIAGRIVSVIAGFIALLGIYFLSKKLFDKKIAIIGMLLYVFNPLFFFFDRQALMESAICAVGVWTFYFLMQFIQINSKKYAISLGLVLGIGLFIKSTTIIFLISLIILLIYSYSQIKNKTEFIKNVGIIFLLIFCVDLLLIINPQFWATLHMNQRYVYSVSEILHFPIMSWINNILLNVKILIIYFNPLIFISSIAGIILLIKDKNKNGIFIFIWIVVSFVLEIILTKHTSQRYLVPLLPILIIPAAYSFSIILKKSFLSGRLLLIITIFLSSIFIFFQMINPALYIKKTNKLSGDSSMDYISGFSSGYGVNEARELIKSKSTENKIYLATALNSGNPESAMQIYFAKSKNVTPTYIDESLFGDQTQVLDNVDCLKFDRDVYFVTRNDSLSGFERFFDKVAQFKKPEGNDVVGVYELKKNCKGKFLNLVPQEVD